MTDNKKYIINVGDQAEEWTSDMYAQKGDSLFAKYKDAEVFEVEDAADFDEDPTDHQYIINVGDESEVWDGDMVKEKGTKLKEAYPDVKIQRVSYKDYWGEQATANREQRALLAQPDQERNAKLADLGYYDDITGEAFSYTQSEEGIPQWGPSIGLQPLSSIVGENEDGTTSYADPKVAEFFASDTSYTDRQAEIARLDAEYESNPSVITQREYEAQWRADQAKYNDTLEAQIRKDAEADGMGDAQRRQNRKMAPLLGMGNPMLVAQYNAMYADAELPTKQSENYASALNMMEKIKELQKVSEKGFGGATLDVAKEKFESWREPDIALYNRVGDILTNLEAEFKDEGLTPENLTPEVLEQHLSNDEKALILAFFQYNSALEDAQQDMSAWYKGGKIFAESVPFMLEFLATGGLYKAAGSAATKGMAGALKKWVLGTAKGSVKRTLRKGAAVALRDLVYAGVGTLARTVVSPGTYNRMAEESVKIEDGHLDRTKNVFKSFADSYIENLSEISGGLIGKGLGLLGKGIGKAASMSGIPFSKLGSLLADNKLMQTITAGWKSVAPKFEALGFHGIFEEVGEEYIGNAIREFTIQPGALAEMHKDDNFGAMLIGFAPMTLFGGAMSAVSIGAKNIEAANLGKKLRETLGQHYSEEQIDHMMNLVSGAENSKDVWEAIKPLTVGLNAEETQQLFQYGAFMAQNKAMLFAKKAQDDNLAQAKRAELQQTYNKFWQENAEGVESVQLASLNDGRTVFVVSEPTADGVVSIIDASTGAKGFTNVSNYKTEEVDGAAVPMTGTWSMDAYLESEIASERRTAESARMEREYNEQVQNLQSQIQEGTKINLGTEGNPVIMLATGKFVKDGVVAVDQAGNTHTIGWNQVADAMNQPIGVKTDQQLIDEEMAAIVARNAERRKRMTDADPAMTDAVNESAAQSAEVVAQENRHIPMNEDGTVNEAAFWEQDPEGYVQWNDKQNQDGGADSLQQVAITKAVLTSLLAEAQQAQQTSNPAERKAAKQRAQEIAEKINRLTAIEASYAEQRIAPLRERAMKWKSLTNAPVYIVETEEDLASISGQAAASNKGGARVRGFAKDGRAYIYLPGIVEESEIDAVFMHEAVAHTGLKGLLGQQAFDELCDQVWEMMSPEMQTVFINYPGVNGNTRAAADEYIAHLAETMGAGIAEAEEKTIWQSVIDFIRNVLRSMGIALNVSESELSDLIHMAYADLAKNMAEAEDIAVQQQEARVAEREAPSAARQEYDTYAEDLTHDEIKAVAANDFNAAQEAYNALVGAAPKVEMGESAKDFIARKKAYNEQVAEAKAALDARQALMDEIARIDAANAPVLTDAEVLEQEGLGVDTQNDDVRMSVRYVPTEKQREMIIGSIMNVTGRTREEAERWLASETSLAAMINEDLQYLDYVADPKYKAIKDNSDYPQGTVDFNNICRKRLPFTRMFTRLQRRFPNRVFTAEELADIRTIMSKDDLMVACGLCYVEDRRQMVGEVAQSFIDGLQEQFKTYANNPTKKKNAKKFNELIAGDTYVPQVYDLTTQEGLDKLYNEHRGIWEAFQAFNNARGQQSQNLLQGYAEYKREILSWSDKKVKSVNDNGGLRIFSYSDFEAHHLIDVVQIIIDCAAKGVKIQGYTKVPEFARAVANTGIKLNRSLIPLGDTGLVDRQLAFDPVEGIDINDPNFLESNDNVGNILIGINDEQIRIAMADPRIHYIIPYHARQKENIRQKLNVGAWTNYISTQNERNISDGKRVKDNINIYTDILTGDVTTDRQFVEKYLQLCKEKGRIPKFDQFLERDAEGNYLYTPGYYKFLVDFKLFDENGNILPQQPVVAEFDDAFNMQILENYAKDERESTGEQMNETYDKIVDALGLDESTAEGEDVRFSTIQEVTDKFNSELQQQIAGTLPKGHIYYIGRPSQALKYGGLEDLPIEMAATTLELKASSAYKSSHPFSLQDVVNLPKAIQMPIAIFESEEQNGKKVVLTELKDKEGKNFLAIIDVRRVSRTNVINSVISLYPKDSNIRIVKWFDSERSGLTEKGEAPLLTWADKTKASTWLTGHSSDVNAAGLSHKRLAKIINNFPETNDSESTLFSIRTDEQREALFDKAKAQFGLTNNFKVAGYMLPDGSLLNFSEANDGGDPNQRTLDHREIEGIIMDEGREYDSRWMYLADFMNEGAIRLLPEYAGINLMKAPTKEQRDRLFDFIYKYNGEVILEIADERLNNVAYVEYDRRTSPSRIFRDIDGYFNEGIVPQQDIRFSVANESQAIFVSNAARAVEGIKMEKATPAQWLAMIEKSGGLKAGEDKWMGLSEWLKASNKKTLTKAEVLDFISDNMIQIEEQHYSSEGVRQEADRILNENYPGWEEAFSFDWDPFMEEPHSDIYDEVKAARLYNETHEDQVETDEDGDIASDADYNKVEEFGAELAGIWYGRGRENTVRDINGIREEYTTNGLTNLHEIALTVPTIESWKEFDEVHFGDAGDGRAVAWIRFGETEITEEGSLKEYEPKNDVEREIKDYIVMGMNRWGYPFEECVGYAYNQITDAPQESVGWTEEAVTAVAEGMRGKARKRKVLVIDEIQSKRHQEGRDKGYKKSKAEIEQYLSDNSYEVKEDGNFYNFYKNGELERRIAKGLMHNSMDKAKRFYVAALNKDESYNSGIPDAPFDKNWHELAMKRMLRYAAEEGYDVIAWTKGEQQAERYNIGKVISGIHKDQPTEKGYQRFEINSYTPSAPRFIFTDNEGKIVDAMDNDGEEIQDYVGKNLSEVFGKDLAIKMLGAEENTRISHDEMRVGGEGMKGFYDRMLPAFMNKYGKKWGIKVEDIDLSHLQSDLTMHSVPVTEEMKASVMEGQVMFSAVQIDPAVRQEMDTIKAKAMWDGTFMKAPNGAETKLTEDQWLLVRTKNFIEWFGDWINDPESASKVVDPETREPRVMYHGSAWHPLTEPKGNAVFRMRTGLLGRGAYFASSIAEATMYAEMATDIDVAIEGNYEILQDEYVTDYFLNIRNTEDIRDFGREDIIAVAKSPSQIKSATDNTGEFSESEDIRYSSRFDVNTNPTEAQKKAGNYKMGHLSLDGYNITIENPKGSVRRGTDSNGNEWENTLNNDYGYIRGTEGVDGDHIDVYLSDNPTEGNVFVIDQVNPETREFDEHKVMYGFNSMDEAREAYLANFSEGWNGLGTITEVTKDEFRKWIDSSHRKTKPFSEYKSVKTDILDEGDIRYSVVTDPALLERLDSEPTIKVYRAMQLIDGKLYPPMSAKVDGKMREPIELGKWEQAEERPDLADEKGYFKLDKGNKTSLKARYNPYFHTSPTPLNDQFSSAQTRPELVTVEVEVPESELTSGYKAEKAKDSVGQMEWKAGVVQGKLSGTRTVILSRWDKPIRIVPDSEVADKIVEMFDGKDITMPSNVVTPSLRAELESRGIPFVETDNSGKPVEADTRYSVLSTPTDEIVAEGMKFSIQDFARLAGNIFQDMPESFRKEAIEETFKRGWDMQSAIFQIPARLAEKENWDEADKDLAKVIREKVQDAMDESGVVMSRPLTTKEALWMLYRSTGANADSMLDAAKRSLVAYNLGFDPKSMALKKAADDIIRYSVVRNRQVDAATDMYNYEANLWLNRLAESWLDMNQSVIALQNALADASGKPIESWEDVVLALNQLSSKSYADKKKYMRDYLEPLWKNVRDKVKRSGLSVEQIERYMMLKHGVERNKKFAMRDAKQFYKEMYDKVADRMKNTSHAEQVVALSEANKRIADIDAQIATASGKKLKDLQEARERAVVEKEIAELVLRNDAAQNALDLQDYYGNINNELNPKYWEFREKDYGGLTSMFMDQIADVKRSDYKTEEAYQAALLTSVRPRFDKVADMEAAAQAEIDGYENRAYMPTLWDAVNAATKEILRHQHASGMITTEQYDAVRNMFDFYVPLRGFADNTAEDMYSYYMNNSAGGFAKPIIAAKGRKTRAESPLGWIGAMAESAIQQDNKNEAKMKLYYALMNRPDTGVLSLTEMWYEFSHKDPATGKKVFVPAYPPATGRALSADDMRQHMDAWEQSMKAKQAVGEAYKKSQGVNLGGSVIFQDKAQDAEHIIRVKVAGKDYAILVNGNPRAAQAINGLLNPDANVGPVRQWYGELRRGMSALMTSFSPLFWVANFQRDLLSSFMRTSESEGWKQAFKYLGNRFHGWKAAKYIYKYDNGKMGNSYYENLYKEFAENGGITGYTFLTTNKEYEKLLEDYIKNEGKEFRNWVKGVWDKFMGFGEAIEQVSRFAAYITARESGKSIEQSVAAAKEVSVNFNRKGSAKPISLDELERLRDKNGKPLNAPKKAMAIVFSAMPLALKEMYFFFNASIQALSSSAKLARKSPGKAMAWAGMYMGLSVGLAFLNYLLAGDDDDNDYLDLPDYLRHSTALFKMGDNYYFKWSLPQEMRPFYATADILVSKAMGKTPHKNAGAEILLSMAEWLPVNPFGTEDPLLALVPDAFAPLAEIRANQNSFGGKIYDDMSYRSEEVVENIPAYRKGTSKTGKIYVDMAEFLNDISGGDEVKKGAININPAIVEHLVEGYGGGIYDFGKMIIGIPGLIDEAVWGEGVEVRDIPFVNKVLLSTDETNMYSHTNDAFNYYRGVSDNAQRIEKEYFTSDDPARAEAYRQEDDWRIHLLYKQYEEDFKDFRKQLDEAVDETEISLLREQQNAVREQLLNDIANGVQPDPLFEAKIDMDRKFDELSTLRKAIAEAAKKEDAEAAEQAQKDLEQFVESEDFKRYAELRPYVKAYEKLRKATKEAGSAETRQELEEATASAKEALDEKLKEF